MPVRAFAMELEKRAGEPEAWLEQAQSLYLAAGYLGSALTAELADSTPPPNRRVRVLGLVRGYMTLLASALESSLKAIAVARDRVKATGGRVVFEDLHGAKKHRLVEMAGSLDVQLSDEERDLLARASAYLRWAGRYPVALRFGDAADDMKKGLLSWRESDPKLAEALAERLCSLVR